MAPQQEQGNSENDRHTKQQGKHLRGTNNKNLERSNGSAAHPGVGSKTTEVRVTLIIRVATERGSHVTPATSTGRFLKNLKGSTPGVRKTKILKPGKTTSAGF